jgi:nucleoside-triphosphatase THEP1
MPKNLLITGAPNVGKSTLIQRILTDTPMKRVGFHTQEIKYENNRVGFRLITNTNLSTTIAHVEYGGPRVSNYGVSIIDFEGVLPSLFDFKEGQQFLYIDEIGQMQLLSNIFHELVNDYLCSANPFVGTIPHGDTYSNDFINKIKARKDVSILNLTRETWHDTYQIVRSFLNGYS